jgi:MOSC domain-containing protein YiiM
VTGTIIQISISRGGIPKRAIAQGELTPAGFAGDSWAHPQIHGGPRQAVLLLASETITELRAAGYSVYPGALGENLTTSGIDFSRLRAGQTFKVGQALIELTKLRVPCSTLDVFNQSGLHIQEELYDQRAKSGDTTTHVWGKGGFYALVVRPGTIRPNDIIALVDQAV